jgi:hypothetical protein
VGYGDIYSGGVWERVEVYQTELESDRTLVDCDGFMVQEHDDPLFQKSRPAFKSRWSNYQKLLDAVSKDLDEPPK